MPIKFITGGTSLISYQRGNLKNTKVLTILRKKAKRFKDPLNDIRASLALVSDPLKEHREMMASISDPTKDFRTSMALMLDPLKDLQASLALISEPFIEIQKTIADSTSLKSIRDIAFEVLPDIEIDSEGVVSLSSKRIAAADLQELSDKMFHNSPLAKSRSLDEYINNLFNEIRSQKDPLTQKILICFVYPLIILVVALFINPVVDHHVKSYLNSDKRVATSLTYFGVHAKIRLTNATKRALAKELKLSVTSAIDNKDVLSSLRYVSVDTLNVRSSNSVKSETIEYLRFSSSVLIIEKQKSWTLIEWNNPRTDAQITGWVFSRYLAKFR